MSNNSRFLRLQRGHDNKPTSQAGPRGGARPGFKKIMKFILNSAVITAPGRYDYDLITIEEARTWLERGNFTSTIGYAETADALFELTGVRVAVNKINIRMEVGDEALVFRLTSRLPQGMKGAVGLDFIRHHSEIGLLRRVAR